MTKPMIRIHDSQTDEVIDREMDDAEFAAYQAEQESIALEREKDAKAATDKADLLAKLGISADEAKLLLS